MMDELMRQAMFRMTASLINIERKLDTVCSSQCPCYRASGPTEPEE